MAVQSTRSNHGGGGGPNRFSMYFFVLVVVILIEVIHFVAHDGGLERFTMNNKSGMDYITTLPALAGTTFTASASLSSSSTNVNVTKFEERISNLEQQLERALENADKHGSNPTANGGGNQDLNNIPHLAGLQEQVSALIAIANSSLTRLDDHDSVFPKIEREFKKLRAQKINFIPPPGVKPDSSFDQIRNDVAQLRQELFSSLTVGKNSIQSRAIVPVVLTDTDGKHQYVNPLYRFDQTSPETRVCFPWKINSDKWWTHNPEWVIASQNKTTYCFRPLHAKDESEFRNTLLELYDIQFRGDCDQVLTKHMWSSGWGADWANIVDGLWMALRVKQPFQIMDNHWHYAAKKDGSAPVCPLKTKDCYFLPMSRCKPRDDRKHPVPFYGPGQPRYIDEVNRWYLSFATRPQQWLRKEVHDFVGTIDLPSPCSVMHVRRGDVVLHGKQARRYHAIEEYVDAAGSNLAKTIFLITDDANAITEARTKFPKYNWIIIDRPRYQGKEGGWEKHIPSDDPKLETVVLLSIFELAKRCDVFVHSRSNLSDYIAGIMMSAHGEKFQRIQIDKDTRVYDEKNQDSHSISKSNWTDWKQQR